MWFVLCLILLVVDTSHAQSIQSEHQFREGMDDIKILEQVDVDRVYTALSSDSVEEIENIRTRDASTPMTEVIPENDDFVQSFSSTNNYIDSNPDGYKLGLIVNPCQGKDPNCCNDSYGNGEYFLDDGDNTISQSERVCSGRNVDCLYASNGESIEEQNVRMALFDLIVDENCATSSASSNCINSRYRKIPSSQFPNCWDRNDTVSATSECRNPSTGDITENCVEIGYTSTAFIMDCKNENDSNCGTFVELHAPGDPKILNEVKLKQGFVSGYRMTGISTVHSQQANQIICRGTYELWWVQRVRSSEFWSRKYYSFIFFQTHGNNVTNNSHVN